MVMTLRQRQSSRVQSQPSKLVIPSSSLLNDLARVRRVQAKPLRGRFASLDTAATAKGLATTRRTGQRRTPQVNVRPEAED